jgi:hypothetical protein
MADFIPLKDARGTAKDTQSQLDGYGFVCNDEGSVGWFLRSVRLLQAAPGNLNTWCYNKGFCPAGVDMKDSSPTNISGYLYDAILRVVDLASLVYVKSEYMANHPGPENEAVRAGLDTFFSEMKTKNHDGSTYTRGGLGTGYYRTVARSAKDISSMSANRGLYRKAQHFTSGILTVGLSFNDAYALMSVKTKALEPGGTTSSLDADFDLNHVKTYYRVEGEAAFNTTRGHVVVPALRLPIPTHNVMHTHTHT